MDEERKQHGPFKKKRGGIVLTRDEVKEIKAGRKKLRKEMKAMGIKSKKEFELTASSLGLYFDKNRMLALLWWFLWGKGGLLLLGLAALLMAMLYGFSLITQLQGHFTISMSDDLFKEGFALSETVGFENPVSHLFCTPAENVPCISIVDIAEDVDSQDGQHNGNYFAYTYYIRNEGESTVDYQWALKLNSESLNLSEAAWVMIFEDGKMSFYAKAQNDGTLQTLPAKEDNTRGYIKAPFYDVAEEPDSQYEVIKKTDSLTYWRLIPKDYASDTVVAKGMQQNVAPMDVHKYTVVIWLEGDDPDCTDELIGGHLGLEMYMSLVKD